MGIITNHVDFSRDYVQLPNAWVRDPRLSYRARGILAAIMSHRDGWETHVKHLVRDGAEGNKAVQAALRELVETGYLRREAILREGGGLAGSRYITQIPENAFSDQSEKDPQRTPFLTGQEPTPKNTSSKNTTKNTSDDADASAFEEFWSRYPAKQKGSKSQAWKKYMLLRKKMTHQDLMERLAHYMRTRSRAEASEGWVANLPHVTTWINQERWDEFGSFVAGETQELTAAEVNDILGPDSWQPTKPAEGFESLEEEMVWRKDQTEQRFRDRRRMAQEKVNGAA